MAKSQEKQSKVNFHIHKVYTQDISYESPNSPDTFKEAFQPQVEVDMHTDSKKLKDEEYEVVLAITITAKSKDKTIFLIEIKQAGVFGIVGTDKDQLEYLLQGYCPGILFPYVRSLISSVVTRGGFPDINLEPIDFAAMYARNKAKEQTEA
ncbi:MAG: protein-export chaperone SecB [Legionellales bacterium]|nr:MAG: protein-export chaperone SecB [Legionellales bacterium]